jgi:hypothetical protein
MSVRLLEIIEIKIFQMSIPTQKNPINGDFKENYFIVFYLM